MEERTIDRFKREAAVTLSMGHAIDESQPNPEEKCDATINGLPETFEVNGVTYITYEDGASIITVPLESTPQP